MFISLLFPNFDFFFLSDAFGPKIEVENIPGTPMEQVDSMILSDSTESNSTSNSIFINDSNDRIVQTRRRSLDIPATNQIDSNNINHKNSNNTSKDKQWSRRSSRTSSDDDSNKRRPSKQDKEVQF